MVADCIRCGTKLELDGIPPGSFMCCPHCKAAMVAPLPGGMVVAAPTDINGFAVASLVLGVMGVPAYCTIVLPLLAVIFSVVAFSTMRPSHDRLSRGLAAGGLACGLFGLLLCWLSFL